MELTNRNEIPVFLNGMNLTGYGAEVGVFRGEYSKHFLTNWGGKKLYLIDAWRHFEGVIDISNYVEDGQTDNFLTTFKTVYPYGNRVSIIRDLSTEAARIFPDNYFDFVYLDACHLYKDVMDDLQAWYPKIRIGGYLMGHDYLDCTIYEGNLLPTKFEVKSAVNGFALLHGVKVHIIPDAHYPSWYFQRIQIDE